MNAMKDKKGLDKKTIVVLALNKTLLLLLKHDILLLQVTICRRKIIFLEVIVWKK